MKNNMKITYIAEWYGPDSISDNEFDPYCISSSEHEDMTTAKIAAFKGASRSNVQGVAYVTERIEPGSDGSEFEYGLELKNECWKNKWQGWENKYA